MKDKSFYSNSNQPQVLEDKSSYSNGNKPLEVNDSLSAVQEYVNAMVQDIVESKGTFNEQNKKLLKKVVEREGLDYKKLEKNLTDLFKLFEDNKKSCSESIKAKIKSKAQKCSLTDATTKALLKRMKAAKPQPSKEECEILRIRKMDKKVFKCPFCGFPVEDSELSNRGIFLCLLCIFIPSVFWVVVVPIVILGIVLGIATWFVMWLLIPVRYKFKKKTCNHCKESYYEVSKEIK
jgi:rubrerythrin